MKIRKIPGFVYKKINCEHVIIPTKEASAITDDLILLNDSGALLWMLIDGNKDETDLSAFLSVIYDISEDKAQTDVKKFLSKMSDIGCIEWK